MVKLLLKDYKIQVASKDLICDKQDCRGTITKGTKYYKYSSKEIWHSLHAVCYASLSIDSIEVSIKAIKDINRGD